MERWRLRRQASELWNAVDLVKAIRKPFEPCTEGDLCWHEYNLTLELETLLRRLARAANAEASTS